MGTEQQTAAALRKLVAIHQLSSGARIIQPVIERSSKPNTYPIRTLAAFDRLIINVYGLRPTKAAPAKEDGDKPAPKTAAKAAGLTLTVLAPLPDGEVIELASTQIAKAGITALPLEFCPADLIVRIDLDGEAEYAVFGL